MPSDRARARLGRILSQVLDASACAAKSVKVEYDDGWKEYVAEGLQNAAGLGNRGPMRFGEDGLLAKDILEAYYRCGFYVFEDVLSAEEVNDLVTEFDAVLDNAPADPSSGKLDRKSSTDKYGRPVKSPGYYGIDKRGVVGAVAHPLVVFDAALHVYAHPKILKMVESIHGADFVPFTEGIFHKGAGDGPPTAWHQDGRTHWDLDNDGAALEQPDGTGKRHGFNLSVCWSTCTPENCLWVVPGSQRQWVLATDGRFPKANARVPGAVPATMKPGDLCLTNRSSLHGAFANRTEERRITMVLGYHNRDSAVGTETTNVHAFKLAGPEKRVKYDEEYVMKRARMIPLAIDARKKRFPDEVPYEYKGTWIGDATWNEKTRAEISKDGDEYWQRDMTL